MGGGRTLTWDRWDHRHRWDRAQRPLCVGNPRQSHFGAIGGRVVTHRQRKGTSTRSLQSGILPSSGGVAARKAHETARRKGSAETGQNYGRGRIQAGRPVSWGTCHGNISSGRQPGAAWPRIGSPGPRRRNRPGVAARGRRLHQQAITPGAVIGRWGRRQRQRQRQRRRQRQRQRQRQQRSSRRPAARSPVCRALCQGK